MNEIKAVVNVGIADLNIVQAPGIIRTSGLGSCVGVVIYDFPIKLAGLAHIMLPDSSFAKEINRNDYKYADTAVRLLTEKLIANGARKYGLQAKLAGGAQMFQFSSSSDFMRIGSRNIEAVQAKLAELHIPVIANDLGGNYGRTIEFSPQTGKLRIRTVNKGEAYI